MARALAGRALRVVAGGLTVVFALWGAAALWIDGPASRPLAAALATALLAAVVVLLARVRPFLRGCLRALAPSAAVAAWWLSIPPRNDRDWEPDVARTATAEWQGSVVTVRDVRDFDYRTETDFRERWDTRRYDLERIYVLADERDVVRLRTSYRGERVVLYRLATPPEHARLLLEQFLSEANALAARPAWYNAFTENCTTAIWRNVRALAPDKPWDWRLLANGYVDRMLYERGTLDTSLPLAELRARSDITEQAKACGSREDFSRCIREGLPAPAARRR